MVLLRGVVRAWWEWNGRRLRSSEVVALVSAQGISHDLGP
jgi:hypothetical protein